MMDTDINSPDAPIVALYCVRFESTLSTVW